jgi:CheY-like chemotaxis protein
MDCQMPEMDGFEATGRIRASKASWSKISIIAVTANAIQGKTNVGGSIQRKIILCVNFCPFLQVKNRNALMLEWTIT